jgi:ribonuclease J
MSKIEFLALGGQDEHGKECYALNVAGDIYIINCGISTPPAISLGIKKIIPDFAWVNENKRNIKGIFIGTPTYQHFGGLEFLHPFLPDIPIYVTDVGSNMLRTYFEQRAVRHELKPIKLNIRIIEPMKAETIGQCLITPFKISNSMPRSVGFVFTTKDGCVIYIDDFIYSANRNISFEDQVSLINQITKNNNLLLLVGTGQTSKNAGFTNPSHRCIKYFNNLLIDAPGKAIVGIFEDDLYKVLSLCIAAAQLNRPICFASKSDEFIFEQLRQKQYFNSKNQLIHLDQLDKNEKAVLIIIGTQQHLFTKLRKIITGDNPLITIKPTDSFIFAAPTISGYETMEAQLFDDVDRTNLYMIHKLDKNILSVSASAEDQKLLVEFLHPKYIIPISGLYMNFVDYQKHILATGFNKADVLFVENGQIIS